MNAMGIGGRPRRRAGRSAVLVAVLAAVLTGCGQSTATEQTQPAASATQTPTPFPSTTRQPPATDRFTGVESPAELKRELLRLGAPPPWSGTDPSIETSGHSSCGSQCPSVAVMYKAPTAMAEKEAVRVLAQHLFEHGYTKSPPKFNCINDQKFRGRVRTCHWIEPEVLGKRTLIVEIQFWKRGTELWFWATAEPDGLGKNAVRG